MLTLGHRNAAKYFLGLQKDKCSNNSITVIAFFQICWLVIKSQCFVHVNIHEAKAFSYNILHSTFFIVMKSDITATQGNISPSQP